MDNSTIVNIYIIVLIIVNIFLYEFQSVSIIYEVFLNTILISSEIFLLSFIVY